MVFKLGSCLVQFDFVNYPYRDALEKIKEIGYEGVETHVPPEVLAKGRTRLRALLQESGLEPDKFRLGAGGKYDDVGILAEEDKTKVRDGLKNFKQNILLAHENGFTSMVTFSGPKPTEMPRAKAFKLAGENLGPVADFAQDHDVDLVFETFEGALAYDSNTLLKLRELSGSKNVYANVDPSNYWVVGDDVVKAVTRMGPIVRGVHIKDVIKIGKKTYWAPPGRGLVDWLVFLKALKSVGYDRRVGWLNVEYEAGITGKFDKDPVKGSTECFEYISSLLRVV